MDTQPDWKGIIGSLQKWRTTALDEGSGDNRDPSVTTVAEKYRQDPWAVLASTILSLRTKDEVTLVCSQALLKRAPTPQALLSVPEEELLRLVYPAGFYRTKAENLRKIARILEEQYGGKVPADMEALLALPGVGRKTANLVIIEAFDMDGICVDTHVHRICNRAGWLKSRSPDKTEGILRQILPRKYWKGINALLVLYGQHLCRPLSPFCSRCVIQAHCRRVGVEKSR
ncbi:MAG: endonuclease III [Spirochaetaceae bacterium]|jgi:endonuclease-3|nr:endonuclease III [Spirochaetaceae bacterium]